MNKLSFFLGATMSASIALGSTAMAQQGTTSGPASGRATEPSTAVQKQNPSAQGTGTEAAQGAMGAGAPGVSARPGTEAGPPPSATGSTQSPSGEAAQAGVGAGSPGVSAKPGAQGGPSPQSGAK
jgi:hypothetical protein